MESITVQKCAPDGTPILEYAAVVAEQLPYGVRLSAAWERPALELGYVTFEPGDHFTEWFFTDRWYNILEVHGSGDGELKGWYCNVAMPASIQSDLIAYRDLYLDVWVTPDGRTRVLDVEEFAVASLDAATRRRARAGLRRLLAEVEGRQPPFDAMAGRR